MQFQERSILDIPKASDGLAKTNFASLKISYPRDYLGIIETSISRQKVEDRQSKTVHDVS